jgi:hypothetical protein
MKKKNKAKEKLLKQLEKEYLARQLIIVDQLKWEKIKGSK